MHNRVVIRKFAWITDYFLMPICIVTDILMEMQTKKNFFFLAIIKNVDHTITFSPFTHVQCVT